MKPEQVKASNQFKGKVDFIMYDADANKGQSNNFKIEGFPTLFWFNANQGARSANSAVKYTGGRSLDGIVKWINKKLAGDLPPEIGAVVELDDNYFEKVLQISKNPAVLFIYAPWCDHCTNMKAD